MTARRRSPLVTLAAVALAGSMVQTADWPSFRGTGASLTGDVALPVTWAAPAWTRPLRGYGQSTPVIVDATVFVTTVEGTRQQQHHVTAVSLETGEVRWLRTFDSSRDVENTDYTSKAASTPVADADGVVVILPTGQLIALATDGTTRWTRDLAADLSAVDVNHGYGSSLGQTRDLVIVQMTARGPSYVAAFSKADGSLRWKADRAPGVAWTSPIVIEDHAGARVIVSAAKRIDCFDADGRLLWSRADLTVPPIATPTVSGTRLILAGTERDQTQALDLEAAGATVWTAPAATTDFSSPLVTAGLVLVVNKVGGLTALDDATGATRWTSRLPGAIWASAIASPTHAYFFTAESGQAVVLRPDPTGPHVVATNPLPGDGRLYGVAVSRGKFVMRTGRTLAAVAAAGRTTEGAAGRVPPVVEGR